MRSSSSCRRWRPKYCPNRSKTTCPGLSFLKSETHVSPLNFYVRFVLVNVFVHHLPRPEPGKIKLELDGRVPNLSIGTIDHTHVHFCPCTYSVDPFVAFPEFPVFRDSPRLFRLFIQSPSFLSRPVLEPSFPRPSPSSIVEHGTRELTYPYNDRMISSDTLLNIYSTHYWVYICISSRLVSGVPNSWPSFGNINRDTPLITGNTLIKNLSSLSVYNHPSSPCPSLLYLVQLGYPEGSRPDHSGRGQRKPSISVLGCLWCATPVTR